MKRLPVILALALLTVIAAASVWTLALARQQACRAANVTIGFEPTPFGHVNVDPLVRGLPPYEPRLSIVGDCPLWR